MKLTLKLKLIMKKSIQRVKRLIRRQGPLKSTTFVTRFQAPSGDKLPLDLVVDQVFSLLMAMEEVEDWMLEKFFSRAALLDAPLYELDQFFAKAALPDSPQYQLDQFFAKAAWPEAPQYQLDQFFEQQQYQAAIEYALDRFFSQAALLDAPQYHLDEFFVDYEDQNANKPAKKATDRNCERTFNLALKKSPSCSFESYQALPMMRKCMSAELPLA